MSTIPESPRAAFMTWCQTHAPIFVANAAAIGLTPAQATAYAAATEATQETVFNHELQKQTAKVATVEATTAVNNLKKLSGDMVKLIRAFAETQPDPIAVCNTAQIPPPATPTPAPPPAQPTNLTVTLTPPTGALLLEWKAQNPAGTSGTSYIVRRKLPSESEFIFVGVTGKKQFLDSTFVAGPDSVQYTVQGQRADRSGPVSEVFTVNFGKAPNGMMTASVTSPSGGTLAADQALVNAIVNSAARQNGNVANGMARR